MSTTVYKKLRIYYYIELSIQTPKSRLQKNIWMQRTFNNYLDIGHYRVYADKICTETKTDSHLQRAKV